MVEAGARKQGHESSEQEARRQGAGYRDQLGQAGIGQRPCMHQIEATARAPAVPSTACTSRHATVLMISPLVHRKSRKDSQTQITRGSTRHTAVHPHWTELAWPDARRGNHTDINMSKETAHL